MYKYLILILLLVKILSCAKNEDSTSQNEDSTSQNSENYEILATLSYKDIDLNLNSIGQKGGYIYLTKGDLNNDQLEDIIFGHFAMDDNGDMNESSKLGFFINSGTDFSINTNIFETIPKRVKPRFGLVGDYNGDGKNDLFVACYGWDSGDGVGEQNILLLSNIYLFKT